MFDVSFAELMVIAVVALIVIGPERLPKVARTLGLLAGRMQRYVSTIKADVERELQAQELQKIQSDVRQEIASIESELEQEVRSAESAVEASVQEVAQIAGDASHADTNKSAS